MVDGKEYNTGNAPGLLIEDKYRHLLKDMTLMLSGQPQDDTMVIQISHCKNRESGLRKAYGGGNGRGAQVEGVVEVG